jgi:hypothetical protein
LPPALLGSACGDFLGEQFESEIRHWSSCTDRRRECSRRHPEPAWRRTPPWSVHHADTRDQSARWWVSRSPGRAGAAAARRQRRWRQC